VGEDKRNPLDFALWKKAKPGEPSWPSPWGEGRPGWHIECTVMALDKLGDDFDLHGGGIDLAFPHHENERAQALGGHHRFARHWVHNGMVTMGGEKMSKSIGNTMSLTDLLDRYDGRAYRVRVLQAHYRSPVEITEATMDQAAETVRGLDAFDRATAGIAAAEPDAEVLARFREFMDDDLNTPRAVAVLFDAVREANKGDAAAAAAVRELCRALGIELRGTAHDIDDETRALMAERDEARRAKDWARADELRAALQSRGWVVEDGPEGTTVHR
jgi:cysteinyl-tRNA synthetase